MNKIIKRLIIILCIIIFVILTCIIILKQNKSMNTNDVENEIEIAETIKIQDLEEENGIYMYIYSNDVLNKFFDYISEKEKNIENNQAIINLLDKEYIEKNKLTEDNVLDFLSNYKNISSYSTKEIYTKAISQRQNDINRYFYIKGIIRSNQKEEYIYILMKQDLVNKSYNIRLLNENEFKIKDKEIFNQFGIEKNDYNVIYSKGITEYQMCLEYFDDYLNTVKNNPVDGYKLLDSEYRSIRFPNIEDYVKYIDNMKNSISTIVLKQYSIENINDETQYVCIDQFGKNYIFKKNKMMEYTLLLDTYTIELPQFTEKYKNANSMEKVAYNIKKCIEAINNEDYTYVYNKLDQTFKKQKCSTENAFELEIKDNLYKYNKITSSSSSNEGNTYIYKLVIENCLNSQQNKNMTIIMQLKENNDFVMSFSFE